MRLVFGFVGKKIGVGSEMCLDLGFGFWVCRVLRCCAEKVKGQLASVVVVGKLGGIIPESGESPFGREKNNIHASRNLNRPFQYQWFRF